MAEEIDLSTPHGTLIKALEDVDKYQSIVIIAKDRNNRTVYTLFSDMTETDIYELLRAAEITIQESFGNEDDLDESDEDI